MIKQNLDNRWYLGGISGLVMGLIAVLILISIRFLLLGIMSDWNEVDVLPLARQYFDSTWIPGDWYLNKPPNYRLLFQAICGWLIANAGFLAGCIIGRLICYGLVALGLVFIARQMGLHLVLLLLALILFLTDSQGLVAGEWLVGGLETKAFAYGLVLLAIALMLRQEYRWMALLLGLATSFHVLVGGYTFLSVICWWLYKNKTRFPGIAEFGSLVLIYLVGSAFAIPSVIDKLFAPKVTGVLSPSYIYVFLRLPHHLNPASWRANWWITAILYLLIMVISTAVIWFYRPSPDLSSQRNACLTLFELTLISLIPFIFGLAIAPFDFQGKFLQYYPFRLGDIMLPLTTCLLFTRAIQQVFTAKKLQQLMLIFSCVIVIVTVATWSWRLPNDILSLRDFPNQQQQVNSETKDLLTWVRNHTPKTATFISSPVDLLSFSWVAERPTIVKYKLLPQTASGILEWYQRMRDLSSDFDTAKSIKGLERQQLKTGYNELTTEQAQSLMQKYQARYWVTIIKQKLDMPIVYSNKTYIIYEFVRN